MKGETKENNSFAAAKKKEVRIQEMLSMYLCKFMRNKAGGGSMMEVPAPCRRTQAQVWVAPEGDG